MDVNAESFEEHLDAGFWSLLPVNEDIWRRTSARLLSSPPDLFLCSADAVHLLTAWEAGELEGGTSDRHMLNAAPHFGLVGRIV